MANNKSVNKTQSVPVQEVQYKKLNAVYTSEAALRAAGFTDDDIKDLCTRERQIPAYYECTENGVAADKIYSKEELVKWITGEDGKRIPSRMAHFRDPVVDGFKFKVHSCFLQSERDMYNFSPENSSCKFFKDKDDTAEATKKKEMWDALIAALEKEKSNCLDQVRELMEASLPKPKNNDVYKLFGVTDISMLKTKVTLPWVMYRGPNGERGADPESFTKMEAFENDFDCALKRDEVISLVNNLEKKGVHVRDCIIGL